MARPVIRRMFHRRLWLLFLGFAGVGVVMAAQSARLTLVRGDDLLEQAESRLVSERWTPTVRGRILDRKGRELARDEPSFDVLVTYPVITGEWAYTRAQRDARRANRQRWSTMTSEERERLIADALPPYRDQLESMWSSLAVALNVDRATLEERRGEIRQRVQTQAMAVWERWLEEARAEQSRGKNKTTEIRLADVQRPLAMHVEPHMLAHGVEQEIGFRVRRLAERFPGLEVEPSGRRTYPLETVAVSVDRSTFPLPLRPPAEKPIGASEDAEAVVPPALVEARGVATHILGWMRGVRAEDVAKRPRVNPVTKQIDPGHYQEQDTAGARGIEGAFEDALRGQRGRRVRHLDIPVGEPGAEESVDPVAGTDVTLTIDAALQARVHALMNPELGLARVQPWHHGVHVPGQPAPLPDGTPLNGAAVVLEIDSGEILAMVSTPSFTREQMQRDPASVFEDRVNAPWVNRAVSKPYPPGSIVKPLILAAAVTDGVYSLSRAIECNGHLLPERPDRYRCWVFKQFGMTHTSVLGRPLLAPEAMAVSCNIFFYTLGRELGPERESNWYRKFGVGSTAPIHLDDLYAGSVGVVPKPERLGVPHAILMAIGQGPVAWTPLHAADSYATLARGGLHIRPRLVRSDRPTATDLTIDPAALDAALEGLRQSVNEEYGTGHMLKYPDGTKEPVFTPRPGIEVIGKTGTAEAPDLLDQDPNDPRVRETLREGDHSWFVVMAGKKGGRPRYVISVVMEYAGSGGRVSGPICNQIVGALIAEGYL